MQYVPTKQKLGERRDPVAVRLGKGLVDGRGVVLYRLRRPHAFLLYGVERCRYRG
jgi:hypothetical protein